MSMFFQPNYYYPQMGFGNPITGGNNNSGNSSSSNEPYWWQGVISLISHGISAYSGANSGTQVLSSGGRIQAITAPQPVQQPYPQPIYQNTGGGGSLGTGVGSGVDGALSWITQNPLIVLGGALGVYLLMKEPPRRR